MALITATVGEPTWVRQRPLSFRRICWMEPLLGLPMGIGVQGIRLEGREIHEQAIEDIDRFPDATGDEVVEQGHLGIANMMIGNAPEAPVAHMMRA